jgi:hypothetical protein
MGDRKSRLVPAKGGRSGRLAAPGALSCTMMAAGRRPLGRPVTARIDSPAPAQARNGRLGFFRNDLRVLGRGF